MKLLTPSYSIKKSSIQHIFLICVILLISAKMPSTLATYSCPSERYGPAMAYDELKGRLILFGGAEWNAGVFYNDTWAYDYNSNEWMKLNPSVQPPSRFNPGVAYIPDQQAILIFGGYEPSKHNLADTWLFDVRTDTWLELKPPNSPSPRSNVGMVYDEKNKKVILFGGSSNSEYPNSDTWVYDFEYNTWTEMNPVASPRPQYGVGMVYDSLKDRVLLLEGHWVIRNNEGRVSDGYGGCLYVYDYKTNNWTKVECSPPLGRYWYATAYDADLGRMIVFGGIKWIGGYGNMYDETWIYDSGTNKWSKSSEKGPEKRYISGMAYDQVNKVTVLFGGAEVTGDAPGGGDLRKYYSDTWALNATLHWSKLIESAVFLEPDETEETKANTSIPAFFIASLIIGLVATLLFLRNRAFYQCA
jgi:N-acetylneuraminic acid mutarotase